MIASFPLVHRWGRNVHCIVGVLGSLTTPYNLVISYQRGGPGQSVIFGRLLCETNHASLTNQCLTRPVMFTVPDPSPRPSQLHQLFQYDPAKGLSGDINLLVQYLRYSVSV